MPIPYHIMTVILIIIILVCASLFSFLETAIVGISEHKIKSLQSKHIWAVYALKLKAELASVLIFSLFGNSLFNAIFTTLTTVVVADLLHKSTSPLVLPITTIGIAFTIIIFSEALPKVIASKNQLKTIQLIIIPLYYIFCISRPIIWLIDQMIICFTKFLGIKDSDVTSVEELKSMIADKDSPFSKQHRSILINSIELEEITIKEVLIPLRVVEAINISDDIVVLRKKIYTTHYTHIIVYDKNIDNIIGYIHVKDLLPFNHGVPSQQDIMQIVRPIIFTHDFVPIISQIQQAQVDQERIFVAVNEYGDIVGIVCLEDMFEIIFGDFTTGSPQQRNLVVKNSNNELIVDGTMLIRELNELYHLDLTFNNNMLTLNGLVLFNLHGIPNVGVCFKIRNLIFEVLSVGSYWVERIKISSL